MDMDSILYGGLCIWGFLSGLFALFSAEGYTTADAYLDGIKRFVILMSLPLLFVPMIVAVYLICRFIIQICTGV